MAILAEMVASRVLLGAGITRLVLVFFAYSLLGYWMECAVLTLEKRSLVLDRGFVSNLPFCIIYGFGGLIGYALLSPFKNDLLLLFAAGAVLATLFEYIAAMMQIRLFGDFWWDYSQKPFNYRGILCLESTVGWGIVALVVVHGVHYQINQFLDAVPNGIASLSAIILLLAYVVDFVGSARMAAHNRAKRKGAAVERIYWNERWK